jgi:MFS family permease
MSSRSRAFSLFLYNSTLAVFLSYGVFFATVSSKYNLPASDTSLVFGLFAVFYSVSNLVLGLFMNKYGPGRTVLLGGSLMGSGLVLSSVANSYPLLLFTYGVVGGIGSGAVWLPSSQIVFDSFDAGSVRRVTGLVSTGTAAGLLFFPPIASLLIFYWGLQAAFLVVGLIVLLLALATYGASRSMDTKPRFDLARAVKSLKTRQFGYLYTYYAAGNAFSRTLVTIFLVPLVESRGMGTTVATIALTLVGVGSLMGRLTAGIQRLNEETIAAIGFLLQGASTAALFLSNDPVTTGILSVFFGIGYGTYIPEFPLLVRKHYGVEHYGTIFGTLLTSFGIGAFIGPVFEGFSVSSSTGFLPGFVLSSAVSLVVGAHLLIRGKRS